MARILIVEDDPIYQQMLTMLIDRQEGHIIDARSNVDEVVSELVGDPPWHVAFIDAHLAYTSTRVLVSKLKDAGVEVNVVSGQNADPEWKYDRWIVKGDKEAFEEIAEIVASL